MADVKICDKCGERITKFWVVGAEMQQPGYTSTDRRRTGEACSERCAHELLDAMVSSLKTSR
jgi:hypothetical protein